MSKPEKFETVSIGQYLVSKKGTRYIKLEAKPNADAATKELVRKLAEAIGSDVLYVNMFDEDFRAKHNIPDFSKGRITVQVNEVKTTVAAPAAAKAKPVVTKQDEEVDF
jgi:hypothetical protein